MSLVTMREILPYAEEKKIAIPAFNIDTMEITQAILETVEEENCPAIIAVGQAAIKDGKLESLAATVRTLAKDMKTPVVLHLDHGQSVEQVVKALCAGFTSVMIDGLQAVLRGQHRRYAGGRPHRQRCRRLCGGGAGRDPRL